MRVFLAVLVACLVVAPGVAVADAPTDVTTPVDFADHYTRETAESDDESDDGGDSDDADETDDDPPDDRGRYRDGGLDSGIGGDDSDSNDNDDNDDNDDSGRYRDGGLDSGIGGDDDDNDDDTGSDPPQTDEPYTGPRVEDLPIRGGTPTPDGNATVGTGGGGGLLNLSPAGLVEGVLAWIMSTAVSQAADQLDQLVGIVSGIPAPGEPRDPSTWVEPQNGAWGGVYDLTIKTLPFAMLILLIALMRAFATSNAYDRRERLTDLAVAFVAVLMTWFLAPLGLHLSDLTASVFHPAGQELVATPESFAALGFALIIGVVVAVYFSSAAILVLILFGMQYFLAHAVVFFWPLAWACWALGGYARAVGRLNLYLYLTLLALNVIQSMLLGLAFEFAVSSGDLATMISSWFAFVGAIVVAFGLLPLIMLKQATVGAAVGLGVSAGQTAASQGYQRAKQRVGDVRGSTSDSARGSRSADGRPSLASRARGGSTASDGGRNRSARGGRASTRTRSYGATAAGDRHQRRNNYTADSGDRS